jgi:hypothetical protein
MTYGFVRGTPGTIRSPVGARKHYSIAVWITQPAFPMVRPAIAGWRIAIAGLNHLDLHFFGAVDGRVELVNLEPQKHAVAVRLEILIADRTMMVFHIPSVQLQDQSPIRKNALVLGTAMTTLAVK